MIRLYRVPGLGAEASEQLRKEGGFDPGPIETEYCFYIQSSPLTGSQLGILRKYLATTYLPEGVADETHLGSYPTVLEVGPRQTIETVASSTTVSVFRDCGLTGIERIERSVRMGIPTALTENEANRFLAPLFRKMVFDRMTQERYLHPLETFDSGRTPDPVIWVPIMTGGMSALREACGPQGLGLSLDDQDMEALFALFHNRLGRDPNDVELFMFGQEWSEHCDHGYWKSKRTIDGAPAPMTLMEHAKAPLLANPGNSRIAFGDEASVFCGIRPVWVLVPENPGAPSVLVPQQVLLHPAITDESHCHPTLWCPFEGAATGIARVRDGITVARGGEMVCGYSGMLVGNLSIEDYLMLWETRWVPVGGATPLEIALEGRNGAWAFANALGEPSPGGWFYTLGLDPGDGYRGYVGKPVFFTGGHSLVREEHLQKIHPLAGKVLVKWGGEERPVGVGGGSGSSMSAEKGDDLALVETRGLESVQRGAPETQQRGVRVARACIEAGILCPLEWPKDLGAGGDITAIPEIAEKCGVVVEIRAIKSADKTMSVRVLLGNESQEQQIASVDPTNVPFFGQICERERCNWSEIGWFTGDGQLVMHDEWAAGTRDETPIDLPLDGVFGKRPQKTFAVETIPTVRNHLRLPRGLSMAEALDRVLRLPGVACKSWLTNRVDRSVSGRTVQQSCIGPYQLPAADHWIMAASAFDSVGTVMTSAVRPHIGLISPEALARMTLAEALLGMSGAVITALEDVCTEVNWFSAPKKPGEGAVVERVASTLADEMIAVGIRQLGGKDSSSGYGPARSPMGETVEVKWPVTTVVSAAAQMPDMTMRVTPVIEGDTLIHIDLSPEFKPLGASALAQVFAQTGNDCADVAMSRVVGYFNTTQNLVREGLIKSLHDISDGGLITTLLEMAFVSGVGLDITTNGRFGWKKHHLSEVPGIVIACDRRDINNVLRQYRKAGLLARVICENATKRTRRPQIRVTHNGREVLHKPMLNLRQTWMETSFRLDEIKANPECIEQERRAMASLLKEPPYKLTFTPTLPRKDLRHSDHPMAAIIRAPGSNGDRELCALAHKVGFVPKDILTTDLFEGRATLDDCLVAFQSGGFSYMDEPLEAGGGWAASVRENRTAWEQYENFFINREDTLSYHPCNGTQVATVLGLIPNPTLPAQQRPRFLRNHSGSFESRLVTVQLLPSPAVMFRGMEGMVAGILTAHGEGQAAFPDQSILDWVLEYALAPMRYVNTDGEITEDYPFNPNGSPHGIAGLCTLDGRHVATMPHIERLFEPWQWPWMPRSWRQLKASPWIKAAQNMYDWCLLEHR